MTSKSAQRDAAIRNGDAYYFTGMPCKRGHIAKRLVSNYGCIECHIILGGEWLKNNPDRVSQINAKWRGNNSEKRKRAKRSWDEKNKDKVYARNAEWQRQHPVEHAAHNKVYRAKKMGLITPKSCERCGAGDVVHTHHEDHYRPMDVIWLCPSCHATRHWEIRKIEAKGASRT